MNSEPDEPALFDLPLAPPGSAAVPHEGEEPAARRPRSRPTERHAGESLPLFGPDELGEGAQEASEPRRAAYEPLPPGENVERPARPVPVPSPRARSSVAEQEDPAAAESDAPATAPLATRMRAGLGDLVVLAAVGAGAALGARALGGALTPREAPALLAFLLAFSFLYCVVSLAFWGQTPGMAWSGLVAKADETEPLSFGQTARRWLGHWLTWALAGLPALLALSGLGGRSLADRISGSTTYELYPRG